MNSSSFYMKMHCKKGELATEKRCHAEESRSTRPIPCIISYPDGRAPSRSGLNSAAAGHNPKVSLY